MTGSRRARIVPTGKYQNSGRGLPDSEFHKTGETDTEVLKRKPGPTGKRILVGVALLSTISLNVSAQCLEYEPTVVTLSGTLIRATYPGRPNYESIERGDEPETILILQLRDPVCVTEADELNEREEGEKEIQLNLNTGQNRQYQDLVGLQLKVSGTLFHGHTGHHHKPLLLTVNKIFKEFAAESVRIHGRLVACNGNPSCRIWIVGTKRILGIHELEEECPLPVALRRILDEDVNDRLIYADFTVRPLTEQRKGVMQMVQLESAENIVVTTRDRQFLRKINGLIKEQSTE